MSEMVNWDSDQDYPCFDISATLRRLADEVDSGEINALGCVVLFQTVNAVYVHGLGPGMDSDATRDLLVEGLELLEDDEEEA